MTDCIEPNGAPQLTTIARGSEEEKRAEECAETILALLADEPHTVRSIALALIVETFVAQQVEKGAPIGTAVGMILATAFARAPDAALLAGYRFTRDERAKIAKGGGQ